ncbi:AraC family transcriptional regulator [Olleya sp. YS]|uniref:AraC family transcriptional regulator n=1 Tax=Olleya sp. YS TaxID=3028318 RepID=UPI00243416A2|nr:AraC family transcriptional regulator [Olleya sp. YS]WGD35682.1 AraC family transcriptional regulator [Olleya sp. YS]
MRFTFLFLFFITTLSAQETDSLSLKSYEELSDLINKTFQTDADLAKEVTLYYISKAKKEANPKEEISGLAKYIHANILDRNFGDFKTEEERILELAAKYDLQDHVLQNFYVLANTYFFQGIWGKSIEKYTKALNIAKSINNYKFQSIILTQLGYVKSVIGDHEKALSYQKEALKLNRGQTQIGDSNNEDRRLSAEISSLYFISRSYINSKQKDSAKAYIDEAININELVKDSCLSKAFYRTKGEVDLLYNNFKQAISNFEISKTYCLPLSKGDSLLYSGCYGRAYMGLKQYDKAISVLEKGAHDYGVRQEEEGFMDDHYKLLAKAYKHTGNIEKSNFYFEKYIHTTEEFSKIQDTVISSFKNEELKSFKAELDAIKSESNKKGNYLKYLALVASIVILALLFFLLKFYRNKKQNEIKFQELLSKFNTSDSNTKIVDTKDEVLDESTSTEVNEEVKQQILEGLLKLEEQEYFLKKECNSYNVAKKIKTNTSYLSKVINAHYQKNFNTYINDLRINYAIIRLKEDSRFRSFSIQSIAEELGYKSADSFTKYFKQHTDLNPSFYIKQLKALA